MSNAKHCTSCNKNLVVIKHSTTFPCPDCKEEIARCGECRELSVSYTCGKCGFEGP